MPAMALYTPPSLPHTPTYHHMHAPSRPVPVELAHHRTWSSWRPKPELPLTPQSNALPQRRVTEPPAHQQTTISGNLIPAPPALSLDMRVRATAVVAAHRRGGALQLSGHCYHGKKRALAHSLIRIQRLLPVSVHRRFALQMITDLYVGMSGSKAPRARS